ncbi:OsmC family protein [Prolixibacter denitrificans]|uniref:Osmotically inducible protein C n=1 Tax=Prolixibacter denitrificans TaxID=1541063 RepID=A0A2P8CHI3_9BACT|nr:OsmC family protein [Prolixibacter denitrificans]PSK84389.1 putative redox protein [Prolixibacter denitrificans]GET20563.1 osmotically inducible protein C [Prolixibacter denitrificans]
MKHMVDLAWHENMFFDTVLDGHRLIIDASEESGGTDKGPRPKKLMLLALAGCTAMDVISMLRKMKIIPDKFNVIVEAEVTDEHPKKYDKMHVIYQFSGKDLPLAKLERAVQLSEEKYCGVSAVYREVVDMTSEIRIV